ncbi:MAG: hypothetical protein WCI91_00840 [Candidatus Nomurabacteria bacterium]
MSSGAVNLLSGPLDLAELAKKLKVKFRFERKSIINFDQIFSQNQDVYLWYWDGTRVKLKHPRKETTLGDAILIAPFKEKIRSNKYITPDTTDICEFCHICIHDKDSENLFVFKVNVDDVLNWRVEEYSFESQTV